MQEIAKYILSQLPKLNDSELNSVRELANTIHTARQVRKPHIDNPLLTHGVGYAKGFPIIDELDEPEHHSLKGDWVVRNEEPL